MGEIYLENNINLVGLDWWQVIALVLYKSNKIGLQNIEICNDELIDKYLKQNDIANKTVYNTITKELNRHYIKSTDKQKNEPYVFEKNNRLWVLNGKGREIIESLLGQ